MDPYLPINARINQVTLANRVAAGVETNFQRVHQIVRGHFPSVYFECVATRLRWYMTETESTNENSEAIVYNCMYVALNHIKFTRLASNY